MTDKDLLDEIEKEFGSHAPTSADDSGADDLDAFLADLKNTISAESRTDSAENSEPPKESAPIAPSKKEKKQRAVREMEPKINPIKDSIQTIRTEKEPGRFTQFVIRHHVVINICLLCLCLALVGGIAAVILIQGNADPLEGKIMDNVFVAGVNVGGMTKEEAYDAVIKAIGTNYTEGIMNVEFGNSVLVLAPSQTRPVLQVEGAVEEAYTCGRTGSNSQRQQEFRDAQFNSKIISLEPYLSLNTDYIRNAVSGFVDGFSGEYIPSGYALEGEMPALNADDFDKTASCQTLVIQTGNPGSSFDVDGICNAVLEGYYLNQFDIQVPDKYLPDFPEPLDIDAIYQQLHVDAVEAVQDPVSGDVTPGSCGYTFDLAEARSKLEAAGYGQEISIPLEYIIPEKLDINGSFTETLSTYSTPVSSNEAYNQNMKLLCKQLDGLILEPGDSFSFDTFFESRTEKNGYQLAPRHGDICAEEEVGGGADQVATTLYVAAMTADLTVNQKNTAEHTCSYTTKGTEITVSADWQDLKLFNSLKTAVKIRAKVTGKKVIIQMLSEEPLDYYIKLETKEGYSIAHGTTHVYKKATDGYTNGQTLVEGSDGCQIILQRVKYNKETDAEISRTTEYVQSLPQHTVIVSVTG